jgi:proteasome assembly chaperone (PAC2) family protein
MDRRDNIIFTEKPGLRHPYMVCGISGWVDGGEAATGSLQYLIRQLGARRFAEIPIDKFHIFQVPGQVLLRPQIKIEGGLLKEHRFPQNRFFYWVNRQAENDLILFLGTEPNLHWGDYVNAVLGLAEEFSVSRIYIFGGVLNSLPHTREPNVSCTCTSVELKEEMQKYGVSFSSYEGPGSFGTTLLAACQKKGLPMVSMMASATYYPEFNIIVSRNPKSIRALIVRLAGLLRLNLDLSDLDDEVQDFEGKLNFVASQSPEFKNHVEELEKEYIEIKYEESLGISADEAVRIAEELLKRDKDKD